MCSCRPCRRRHVQRGRSRPRRRRCRPRLHCQSRVRSRAQRRFARPFVPRSKQHDPTAETFQSLIRTSSASTRVQYCPFASECESSQDRGGRAGLRRGPIAVRPRRVPYRRSGRAPDTTRMVGTASRADLPLRRPARWCPASSWLRGSISMMNAPPLAIVDSVVMFIPSCRWSGAAISACDPTGTDSPIRSAACCISHRARAVDSLTADEGAARRLT